MTIEATEPTVTTRILPLFTEPVPADADHVRVLRCEYDEKARLIQALWPERLAVDTDPMTLGMLVGGGDYKVQACDVRGQIRAQQMHHFMGEPKQPSAGGSNGGNGHKGRVVALGQEFGKAGGIIMVDGLTGEQNAMLLLFQQRALEVREDARAMVDSFAKVFESIAQMQREPASDILFKQMRNSLEELADENRKLRRRNNDDGDAGSMVEQLTKLVPDLPKVLEAVRQLGAGAGPGVQPVGVK